MKTKKEKYVEYNRREMTNNEYQAHLDLLEREKQLKNKKTK